MEDARRWPNYLPLPLLVVAVSSIAPPVIGEVEATPVDSRVALAELLARSNQPRYESTVLRWEYIIYGSISTASKVHAYAKNIFSMLLMDLRREKIDVRVVFTAIWIFLFWNFYLIFYWNRME